MNRLPVEHQVVHIAIDAWGQDLCEGHVRLRPPKVNPICTSREEVLEQVADARVM